MAGSGLHALAPSTSLEPLQMAAGDCGCTHLTDKETEALGGEVICPWSCRCTHLTDKETEALGGEVICPWSCSQAVAQPTLLKPESSALGVSPPPRSLFYFLTVLLRYHSHTKQFTHVFIYLAALGLHCCVRAFSSCGEWGLLLVAEHSL